jgi:glycosyltransferase involved in cell wall biosynthesis
MKILFICEGLNHYSIVAQPWKHVIEIAKRTRRMGIDSEIVTDQLRQLDNEIEGVPLLPVRRAAFSFDIDALSRLIKEQDPDVINWHCSDIWSSVYFWRLRNKISSNIVWTLHSGMLSFDDLSNLEPLDFLQLYKFWNNLLNAAIPKAIIKKWLNTRALVHIITISGRTARKLSDFDVRKEMITHIPSGVDIDFFRSLAREERCPRILHFGPISRLRGIDTLLSAFKYVKQEIPSARLVLLARGSRHSNHWVRKMKSLGNVDLVTGVLDQKKLVEQLDSASVVVLPFRFWPQVDCPLTILEAMAMKKPTVSTSIGAIPEILVNGKNGFLVPPKDSKELAKSITRLLKDRQLSERIGQNARDYVEHFHDWNIITKNTLEILSRTLN